MYSYEDRIRAVKLYIKLGKRAGATIRQFGYPTKNCLKSWHEQYEQGLDLSRGTCAPSRSTRKLRSDRPSSTTSSTGAALPSRSRPWGTHHVICCVPGFVRRTLNCTGASSVDLTVTHARQQ